MVRLELAGGRGECPSAGSCPPPTSVPSLGSVLFLGVAIKIPIVCVVLEGGPGTLQVSMAGWEGACVGPSRCRQMTVQKCLSQPSRLLARESDELAHQETRNSVYPVTALLPGGWRTGRRKVPGGGSWA